MAIQQTQYEECRLDQRLGQISNYNILGDISHILHIPVPCLEDYHFYRLDKKDDLFHKLTDYKYQDNRNKFRDMYAQIAKNIIALIEIDTRAQ